MGNQNVGPLFLYSDLICIIYCNLYVTEYYQMLFNMERSLNSRTTLNLIDNVALFSYKNTLVIL